MANDLIYKSDARRAILKADPSLAYVIDEVKAVDAVEVVHAKAVPIYSNIEYEDTLIRMDRQCALCSALIHRADNYCPHCGASLMDGGNEDA